MECTQRLEYTQEISDTRSERPNPEQIGFLGICGSKYPLHKGPNKIGRDPQTCNITLNLNSISRQHAVVNILNKNDFMLMDLDSANKTKLSGQVLKPYIPHPLHNGDTVQFGEIFGIFRLLEDEDDLPMTQEIDIPDTAVPTKHMSRVNAVTTIPESPDVSDKEDSFIVPSQPKRHQLQSAKTNKFIKPGKTISIQPVGTNKIDNIYWNSSKKSASLNLEDSDSSLSDSIQAAKLNDKENKVSNDIHELDTQEVFSGQNVNNYAGSINTASTQLPDFDGARSVHTANIQMPGGTGSPSIHNLNTQMPPGSFPSIHSINTQMPEAFGSPPIHCLNTQLPEVCKIYDQQDMHVDLYAKKNNNDSIYNAETQPFLEENHNIPVISRDVNDLSINIKSNHLNKSNEELAFDEVDSESLAESQAILADDIDLPINRLCEEETDSQSQIIKPKYAKRNMRIKSDSSTDCDDIDLLPTQQIIEKKCDDDDTTDCEEEIIQVKTKENETNLNVSPKTTELFEEAATQVIELDEGPSNRNIGVDIEDIPTQILHIDDVEKEKVESNTDVDFEDLPTQVLDDDIPPKTHYVGQQISDKIEISPFKVPPNSVLKAKRRDLKTPKIKLISVISKDTASNTSDKNYYLDTQDLYDDLCTQRLESTEDTKSLNESLSDVSVSDMEKKVNDFVSNLSSQEVRDMIGVRTPVSQLKNIPSNESTPSDAELPPKKQPFKFMDIDLPNSQEIKTTVSISTRSIVTESSSESDTENNSEDQYTPILFSKKKKKGKKVKLDLTKKFDVEALPSRIITRIRKPTAKVQESKKAIDNILKPKFLTEQEVEIDTEIITENITRLKNKNEKSRSAKTNELNKEINQASNVTEKNIEKKFKIDHNSRKKNEENVGKHMEKLPTNVQDTCKEETRKKREPKNTKKDVIDPKQPPITRKTTKQSLDSTVELKDKTRSSNKSKDTISYDLTNSPVATKRSTRSTRNSKTKDKITKAERKSPEKDSQTDKPARRKYTRKKQEIKVDNSKVEKEPSPEMLVRRSKRQRTIKENKEPAIKSILKNSLTAHEESAVYNVSSGSNSDSSRTFKRAALDDSEVPSPKRTRSMGMNDTVTRATPSKTLKTQHVLFTAFPYETVKVKLEQLGAVVVTDVLSCTVLLTQQIKRTFKLLCAIGLGKPIVGPSWVQACADTNTIVDPWQYLMKDEVAEKRFDFSLERTLTGKRDYLKGYNVSSTPRVMPMAHEMKLIVECSGGTWKVGGPQWICVSTRDDRALWPALRAKGATIVTTEFILSGVLRQRIDIDANKCK